MMINNKWAGKSAVFLIIIVLSLTLGACTSAAKTPEPPVSEEPEILVESASSEESESEEVYYVVIGGEDAPMSEVLVPENATEVNHIENGLSLVSAESYEATVQFYQDIIDEYQIEGKEDTVDLEALGVEQCWKFDGVHEERLFSVTVAANEGGEVGVAVIY